MIRPDIREMTGYTPGEQPRESGILKLNTNENPYPPSPAVFAAIRDALTSDALRKYPDPFGTTFRAVAAKLHGVDPDAILIGNGSDDILNILTRAFVPVGGLVASPTPSYSLYRTLAELQGARFRLVPFESDWRLPHPWPGHDADLTFIANPNSPSGTHLANTELEFLIEQLTGPLVIDEAYVAFANSDAIELTRRPEVVLTRSLSKAYSLAGIRFGYAIADPATIHELNKVKDSYNCDVLSLAAATAALQDDAYLKANCEKILASRVRLERDLANFGFAITPSRANFIWCRPAIRASRDVYLELKLRNILIRYMEYPNFGDGLRITVGTDAQMDQLTSELRKLV